MLPGAPVASPHATLEVPLNDDALTRSALEQAALVRSGEVSSRELVEAALTAIAERDEQTHAFVLTSAHRALAEADAVAAGDPRPLAGVPIAIKDLVLTQGLRTSFGSRAAGDFVPEADAAVVRRLREAGAIVVGKTSTPELGILPITEPERFGPTRNPWDLSRTSGGSSGGSAAAVAAGMVPLAHASDGGGSIRIPAACCGLVGLKPSRGRVSLAPNPEPPLGIITEGVVTRTVADTAAALDVLAGYEPGDPYPAPPPTRSFLEAAGRAPGRLRVAFSTEAPTGVPVNEEHAAAARSTAEMLESLGHEVEEAAPGWFDRAYVENFIKVWIVDIAASARALGFLFGEEPDVAAFEPLTRAMIEQAAEVRATDYWLAVARLRVAARGTLTFWGDHDVFLCPTLAQPPVEIGALQPDEGESPLAMLSSAGEFVPFTPTWNVTGQPAVSLPLEQSAQGLPLGVQLVGPPNGEELLLSLSAQLEEARPWADRRPPGALGAPE